MIRSQRRKHLLIWLALGPAILIGLVVGLWVRRPVPIQPVEPGNPVGPGVDAVETPR